jgi:UDP-N-acetylenolpyruvoylglucosamine reductase
MTTLTSSIPSVVQPLHGGYDEARRAWNLQADLRPAAVVTATSVAEVQAAVRLAAARGLRVAPFTTGHLATALPDLQDTILLRTELGREVVVDVPARRARVPAGAVWEDVVDAIAPHGLAVAHGSSPDVGVVGYVLGGGLSFYARRHGLATNHVLALELVCADGELRRVDADEHADLYWALRGGGGNFGVVTAVEIELLPYAEVFAGAAFWPMADAAVVLAAWAAWTRRAPDSVTTSMRLLRLPPLPDVPEPLRGVPVIGIDGIAVEEADGRALLAELRAAATPMLDVWDVMPAAAALRVHGDPEQPTPAISEHTLLGELDEQAIAALLDVAGDGADCPLLFAELRQLGGALASSPDGAGARGRLEGRFALFGIGVPMAPGDDAVIDAALTRLLAALAPWDTGRAYLNFAERSGAPARRGFDPLSYRRLLQVRATWDPQRRFVSSHPVT